MRPGAVAGRGHVELAGIGLGIGDEFADRLCRKRWMHLHAVGLVADARNRGDVMDETEFELFIERGVDGVGKADQKQRVAVGGSVQYGLGGDIAARARPVLDDELLAEPLRQPLRHKTGGDVGRAAGGETDDNAHGARRVALRVCHSRDGRTADRDGCEMQELAASKFHRGPFRKEAEAQGALEVSQLWLEQRILPGAIRPIGATNDGFAVPLSTFGLRATADRFVVRARANRSTDLPDEAGQE